MKNKEPDYEIDNVDIQILSILLKDATTPYTQIADELIISGGTVHVRMKKLTEMGIVKSSELIIDVSKIGFDVCAFIGIYLEKGSMYKEAVKAFKKVSEVVELHYTTGKYSMFAKIVCKDIQHLRNLLNDQIQAIPGITMTETIISLEESIKRPLDLLKMNID